MENVLSYKLRTAILLLLRIAFSFTLPVNQDYFYTDNYYSLNNQKGRGSLLTDARLLYLTLD